MAVIRKAVVRDASRIAEILVFNKRMNYRSIYHDDIGSFCDIQVYPIAQAYIDDPASLESIWVYEDDFVKGMIHIEGTEIAELYVETFFQNEGIGAKLIGFACREMRCDHLWVLEKNARAIAFYRRHGFSFTEEKKQVEGTAEYIVKMEIPS